MKRNFKVISLFTGAGGLDLGLEAAGFDTVVAVEMDADSVETLRTNRGWPVISRDVHSVPTSELLKTAGLGIGDADLLAGGPPCQPFSKSGYWASGDSRRLNDPRATTLHAYLRILRQAQPKAFLLENVAGLAYSKKREGLNLLQSEISAINRECGTAYSFSVHKLNAADFGVPQVRERVFIIGARDGTHFGPILPTHAERNPRANELPFEPQLPRWRTAWDALAEIQEDDSSSELKVTGKWAELLPSIPEGENYLFHTDRGGGLPLFGWRRRYWSFLLKLSKRLPSWTLTAQPGSAIGPFHWNNRRLSMREMASLQTFPVDYMVTGSRSAYTRQIGNAVPSALTERLGLEIRTHLLKDKKAAMAPVTLVPKTRETIPTAEPVCEVPEKYYPLVGDHSAHPGTGKGFGARRRDALTN